MNKNKISINVNNVFLVYIALMVFFFPTSISGEILVNPFYIYLYYGLSVIAMVWYVTSRYIKLRSFLIFCFLMIYMLLASVVSSIILGGEIAIARVVYFLLPTLLLLFDSKKEASYRFVLTFNEIITIVIIIWNCCLLFGIGVIPKITTDFYSQFNWFTTNVFVENRKPIFTFGIYSYGAFFYAMLFVFWVYVISKLKKVSKYVPKRYHVYALIFISFQILMRGSTALMLGVIMLYFYLRLIGKSKSGFLLIPIFLMVGVVFILSQDYDWNRMIVGTSTNGFTARYLSDWFVRNIVAVKRTILGIGFTIPVDLNLVYTDSGYIVLFTMGGLFLPLCLYGLLYRRLKINFNNKLCKDVFLIMMMFELSLPGLLYIKEITFMIYFFMSIRAVDSEYYDKIMGELNIKEDVRSLNLGENNE